MPFALWLSNFLSDTLRERGKSVRWLQGQSTVPDSTISNYLRGKTDNPNQENLRLIEAALELEPGFFAKKRKECDEAILREQEIMKRAHDRKLLEEMYALNREAMVEVLNDYKDYSDKKTAKQNKAIVEQCRQHEAEYKMHCDELVAKEMEKFSAIKEQDERSKKYLRTLVRNLTILCGILGTYSVYTFSEYDANDYSTGIARGDGALSILHILVSVAILYVLMSIVKNMWVNRKIEREFKDK